MTTYLSAPTLTDGRVTLRAHRRDDADAIVEQCRDPLSLRWTTVPEGYTLTDARRFVTDVIPGGWSSDHEWAFAVEADDGGTPRFAGTVSLRNEGDGRAELAYGAHPWARGTEVMERAVRLLLTWGFTERGLHTVIWWAHRGNWASRRLAWKVGFAVEGVARSWLVQRGELRDAWVATLTAGVPLRPRTPWSEVPRLSGGRVVLRRLVDRDVPRIVEACNDPETVRWLGQLPQPYGTDQAHAFLHDCEERHAAGEAVVWAMADPADDLLLGVVNLFDIRPEAGAEVGYWVHPGARGRGVASEACRLAVRHALIPHEDGGLGLRRVRAVAAEGNLASRRVLEAGGLTRQGRERLALRVGSGALADAVVYDVLSGEALIDGESG